jgi:hypothetical protein
MPVLIDTNLILDVATDDPVWGEWSDAQITRHQSKGLVIVPVIYAELCVGAESTAEVDSLVRDLKLELQELSRAAFFRAAHAFLHYRRRGGNKTSPLPDFFIGAHAEISRIPILTRATARYKSYFPKVKLIGP